MNEVELVDKIENARENSLKIYEAVSTSRRSLANLEHELFTLEAAVLKQQQTYKTGPLTALAKEVYEEAYAKGFWDSERAFPEVIALCHSELSESLEEFRAGYEPWDIYYREDGKPEGMAMEMIDTIIRILDWFGSWDADVDALLAEKFAFNKTRDKMHGGKKA